MSVGGERVGDRDAELAGDMIVAGAGKAQRVVPRRARLMARRHLDGGDGLDAFEHAGDQRRGDAIIAKRRLLVTARSRASTSLARCSLAVGREMRAR